MSAEITHFRPEYVRHITKDYGYAIADQLQEWRSACLPEQPGEHIEYVRLNAEADPDRRPVLLTQGYAAGIPASGPFAADMAHRGYDVIVAQPNRHGGLISPFTATGWQARNLMAVIEAEDLTQTPLDAATHSYGSLIFDELLARSSAADWHCFDGSKVAMMAPAGVIADEEAHQLFCRFIEEFRGKGAVVFKGSYHPHERDFIRMGFGNLASNPGRAVWEALRISRDRLNYDRMLQTVGEIALVPFGRDKMFSEDLMMPRNQKEKWPPIDRYDGRLVAFSPFSSLLHGDGVRGSLDAGHNDMIFNPARVADAVERYFSQPRRI